MGGSLNETLAAQTGKDGDMKDLIKGNGISLITAAAIIVTLIGTAWTVRGDLSDMESAAKLRDVRISNMALDVEGLKSSGTRVLDLERKEIAQDARIMAITVDVKGVKTIVAGYEQRLANERDFAASHRVRLFDQIRDMKSRDVERQQELAIITTQMERMAVQLDRLTDALIGPDPKARQRRDNP